MNIDQYSPQSGRFLKEDGTYINIADALGGTETGQIADIEKHAAHSGRFIKEDGTVINIAESIGSGGGSDSGSSDDSAPPIVETYNGQTIQCSMSADRPIQGLNLYATCEQTTTTGANLFNKNTVLEGRFLGEDGETIVNSQDYRVADYIPVKPSTPYSTSTRGTVTVCFYDSSKSFLLYIQSQNITTPENSAYMRFNITSDKDLDTFIVNEGSELLPYEPYTGGIPSPNGDYPQEIQSTSDFVVEVKNSIGEDATPQTLDITIPEQGFYGIPVRTGGNYTDSSGQQWICDEFDFTNKKFIKRTGRISLDGSADEIWTISTRAEAYVKFYNSLADGAMRYNAECLCNRFIYRPHDQVRACYTSISRFYILLEPSINTMALLREYLNTHPLDVIYLLETPVEYNLTDAEIEQYKKLRSYHGTTYIDNDAVPACNMTAELVVDTKMYIDNKFTTLAGQILEMGV